MLVSEFPDFLAYFIADYAAEIQGSYGLSRERALIQAQSEIAADLPQGVETEGQVLLCIESAQGSVVGYLWYRPDNEARTAFINDFYVFPDQRGRGYGTAALAALEAALGAKGFDSIKLRVAADNGRARQLYEATGFRVTGLNMSKIIGQDRK